MPIRINSETGKPEWKDVGADTWHPFSNVEIPTEWDGTYTVGVNQTIARDFEGVYIVLVILGAGSSSSKNWSVNFSNSNHFEPLNLVYTPNNMEWYKCSIVRDLTVSVASYGQSTTVKYVKVSD